MNLRQQIEKEITDKVMTKLASERVELADVQQLLSYAKGIKNFGKNIDIAEEELTKALRSLKVDLESLQTDYGRTEKGIEFAEKMAKELGLNASQIPNYKEAKDSLKYGDDQIKKAKKYL